MVAPWNTTEGRKPFPRRDYLVDRLNSLHNRIDTLAATASEWRDEAPLDSADRSDYRSVGRRLDKALEEIEKALERLNR